MRICIFLLLSTCASASSGEYYVSTRGNDAGAGTKLSPWRTIQKAVDTLRPGDTANVLAGNYPEHVRFSRSGTANLPIKLKAAQGKVTLNPGSFFGLGRSHIRIEAFHIQNTSGNQSAIEFTGNGGFVEVVGNEISGTKSTAAAIRVGGTMHHFSIESNHVHHNNTGNQEAIRIQERTHDFRIINNEVNDNTNIGIDIVGWARYGKPTDGFVSRNFAHNNSTLAPWAANIYLDGPKNIIVEYNIVTGSEYGFQFGCEPAGDESSGNILRYNIAYENTEYGLGIGGYTGGSVHHCQIYNNVFVDNKRAIGFNTNAGHDNLIVNNILYEPRGQSINYLSQPRNTVIDHNCYFVRYGDRPGKNSITGDPLFKNIAKRQFSLRPSSPCIDAGLSVKLQLKDYAHGKVPAVGDNDERALPDIGVFEFSGS